MVLERILLSQTKCLSHVASAIFKGILEYGGIEVRSVLKAYLLHPVVKCPYFHHLIVSIVEDCHELPDL